MKLLNTNKYLQATYLNIDTETFLPLNVIDDTDIYYLSLPYKSYSDPDILIKVSLLLNHVGTEHTVTAKLYGSVNDTIKTLLAVKAVKKSSVGTQLTIDFPIIQPAVRAIYLTGLKLSIQSDDMDSVTAAYFIYDVTKSIDVGTVNGAAPVTAEDIADNILLDPSNLLKTDVNGNVELSSTTLSSISSNVIDSLASEIGLDASAVKIFKAIASGNVRIKSGTTDTLQYLDTDKQTVLFEAKYSTSGTIKDVTIL